MLLLLVMPMESWCIGNERMFWGVVTANWI
jgi:hypothetical protein